MNEEENKEYKSQPQDSFSWIHRHGTNFLSEVLLELGHPKEPEETLIEILEDVNRKTDVYIINLDHAASILETISEVEFSYSEIHHSTISSRIKARENREKTGKEAASVMP